MNANLKVAVRREDDIKGLEDRVLAHGYEMDIKKSGEEQRPIPPYSYSFEASVQPAAVSGTGRLAGTHSPRGTGAWTDGECIFGRGCYSMKLQRREKILAYSALGIVALVGL